MQNTRARGHPLYVAGTERTDVSKAVAVIDRAGQHIGDRLDPPVRMPWKSAFEAGGIVVAEIVEQQEWILRLGVVKAEGAVQIDTGALFRGLCQRR